MKSQGGESRTEEWQLQSFGTTATASATATFQYSWRRFPSYKIFCQKSTEFNLSGTKSRKLKSEYRMSNSELGTQNSELKTQNKKYFDIRSIDGSPDY
jgi:hypothetical protein